MTSSRVLLAWLAVLAILSGHAMAIGIGPPRTSLNFEPNLQADLLFVVANTIDEPIDATIYVKGDLSQYITLDKTIVTLAPDGQEEFTVFVRLPPSIDPGTHDIRIGAVEAQAGAGGTVGARAGVESQLIISAPFEGKLINVVSPPSEVTFGRTATLRYEIEHIGTEAISELEIDSIVTDAEDNRAARLASLKRPLEPGQTAIVDLTWTPLNRGSYTLTSSVLYDGNVKEVTSNLTVGDVSVSIESISASPFTPGQIAKVSMDVRNEWNQPLSDVYAQVLVSDAGSLVLEDLSREIDLPPFEGRTLEVFLDTAGLAEKEYSAVAIIHFDGRSVEKEFTLSPPGGIPLGIAAIIVALIIIIAVVAFLLKR